MQSACFSLLTYGICECQLCVISGWRVRNGKEKDLKTNTKFFKAYNAIKAIFDENNSRKDNASPIAYYQIFLKILFDVSIFINNTDSV